MSETQSKTPISETRCSTPSSARSIRQKTDVAWKYVTEATNSNGKKILICEFCQKQIHGGGINRMKHHLAGEKGNIDACKKVSAEVRFEMKSSLNANLQKAKEKKGLMQEDDVEVFSSTKDISKGKRMAITGIESYFKKGVSDPSQLSIKACMQSKDKWHETDLAIALWFYDACIPFNAVNSPYFQYVIDRIISMGHGYKPPSYHALRVNLLKDAKLHVKLIIDDIRNYWADTGCTIMGDGWTDNRQRSLINFLVYCPKGISFVKSVDASDIYTNAKNLCNLFSEIVEWVGPRNVVHMVTDNGANYKAAGFKLMEKYPFIFWSPCAAHCINLIFKDIGQMPTVESLTSLASKVTIFVYNHKVTLNWLRKREGWREIIRPGTTRFATNFIALQSLHEHKDDLQALVVCADYKKFLNLQKAKEVKQIMLDENFWENCLMIVRIMTPLIRLLRICDTKEKPSLGYIYEGMYRARTGIMNVFKNKKKLYKPYIEIIDSIWDRMLRQDLHATAYYLNPAFQYDQSSFCKESEIMRGILNVIDKLEDNFDSTSIPTLDELRIFREREMGFSRPRALACSKNTRPDEWWKLFGYDVSNLQKLAIKILSQTASSSGCERNWNVFERIHTKKRNRLEHQRLNDLVYIHYNLRLKNRLTNSKKAYDPIDYESIEKTEFWIVEKEGEEGELDFDEIEKMIEEHPKDNGASSIQDAMEHSLIESNQRVDGDEDGDEDEDEDEQENGDQDS